MSAEHQHDYLSLTVTQLPLDCMLGVLAFSDNLQPEFCFERSVWTLAGWCLLQREGALNSVYYMINIFMKRRICPFAASMHLPRHKQRVTLMWLLVFRAIHLFCFFVDLSLDNAFQVQSQNHRIWHRPDNIVCCLCFTLFYKRLQPTVCWKLLTHGCHHYHMPCHVCITDSINGYMSVIQPC